tara:strand:- start:447 stop:2213 length:1767 start_codon:yes stop_codon:yes gene_type:complete
VLKNKDIETLFRFRNEYNHIINYRDVCDINDADIVLANSNKEKWFGGVKQIIDSEDEIKKYYGDITKTFSMERVTIVLEKKENSISIKKYHFEKFRKVGKKFFMVRRKISYVTFNFKYKNFYAGEIISKKKKVINKKVYTNNWVRISSILSEIPWLVNQITLEKELSLGLVNYRGDFPPAHIHNRGWELLSNITKLFFTDIKNYYGINSLLEKEQITKQSMDVGKSAFKIYMKVNQFGYPNMWDKFINLNIPKSLMKKNGSMVESFMKQYDLCGKNIRIILNGYSGYDFSSLIGMYKLLGINHFNLINVNKFNDLKNKNKVHGENEGALSWINSEDFNYDLDNTEKKHITSIINDDAVTSINDFYNVLKDHLKCKVNLMGYGENSKIRSTTFREFNEEHYRWSDLIQSYRNGTINRIYSGMMKEEIQKPIFGTYVDYYPVLLINTSDYNQESKKQRNCVRTYIEESNCFIVSLREGSVNSGEMATLEFRYQKNESPNNIQSLGKFNESLNPKWNMPIEELQNRINLLWEQNVIVYPTMTKEYPNGKTIERNAIWKDIEVYSTNKTTKRLVWDNQSEISLDFFDDELFF